MPSGNCIEIAFRVNLAARKSLEGSGGAQGWGYANVPAWLSYRRGGALGEQGREHGAIQVAFAVVTQMPQLGTEVIQTVNARELHGFLQNGDMFAHWMRKRIEKYGFQDGVDFTTTDYLGNDPSIPKGRGRPAKEYHVSLDMAKELAMGGP